jgi:enoyl-[acyl-carrier protein] reductase II
VPIVQATLGPWSSVELVAAVSNAGGLGSFGAPFRPPEEMDMHILRIREMSDGPFAINHVMGRLNDDTFGFTLKAKPRVISFAMGDPGDLVQRVHDDGVLFMQQVHSVKQAEQAAERGVDIIVAQGGEAGGYCQTVGTIVLVPQVVDAVKPIPVLAAGGIADGRGLAAALVMGAQGAYVGTRFLMSKESTVSKEWKEAILAARSEDAVKVEFANDITPSLGVGGYHEALPRSLHTPFVDKWNHSSREEIKREALRLGKAVMEFSGNLIIAGQSAGMIREVLPAAEIIRRMVKEAEESLRITTKSFTSEAGKAAASKKPS